MTAYLYRRAQVRGLLGGSRTWTVLWAVLLAVRLARRFGGNQPKVVYRTPLAPGQGLLIRAVPPDGSGSPPPG
jgi:hypothetical protein